MKPEKNRTGSKLLIAICVFFLLGCLSWKAAEIANANTTLKVKISLVGSTYSIARHGAIPVRFDWYDTNAFLVRFQVSNPSSTPCTIGFFSCGSCYQWGTDNTNVSIQYWGCHKNIGMSMTLDSTNVYSGELPIVVQPDTKPERLSFRMFFVPNKKEKCDRGWALVQGNWAEGKYWSNEIKITVVP